MHDVQDKGDDKGDFHQPSDRIRTAMDTWDPFSPGSAVGASSLSATLLQSTGYIFFARNPLETMQRQTLHPEPDVREVIALRIPANAIATVRSPDAATQYVDVRRRMSSSPWPV
jgi:hypothetical protein